MNNVLEELKKYLKEEVEIWGDSSSDYLQMEVFFYKQILEKIEELEKQSE